MQTKDQVAEMLNGREYPDAITDEEAELIKENLVVVFGASDDLMEFRGAIYDEVGCYDGGTALVDLSGVVRDADHNCDCEFCGYERFHERCRKIEAVWCDPEVGGSWSYKTDIPHATFDIMEDGELYCRGIVFSMDDLK